MEANRIVGHFNPAQRLRTSLVPAALAMALALCAAANPAQAFCGFFVGKADGKLFNKSSMVAIARDGNRTVLTMSSDYHGEMKDFALVVPVPTVLQKEQIHVGEKAYLKRLDDFSAPRLVEYHDPDPCPPMRQHSLAADEGDVLRAMGSARMESKPASPPKDKGVTVEAEYTVAEYDIVLLSATQSNGLQEWLEENGYKMPPSAAKALAPYVKQEMKFFVAKVNLKEQAALGFLELRPIQIAFESPKFMLPVRLGMANADGAQDMIVFLLTRNGRVESSNYQTIKIPTDVNIPEYVQGEFGTFYKAAFEHSHQGAGKRALVTEYFWNMGFCDPCSAQPLSPTELRQLGAFWVDQNTYHGNALPVLLTRLHVRYDAGHFPEDLAFQETGDQQNFQARYVLQHQFHGDVSCEAGRAYVKQVIARRQQEAQTLASLTGWELQTIRSRMGKDPQLPAAPRPPTWWQELWKK